MPMAERRNPGPVPRGVREQVTIRVPVDHKRAYEQRARQLGIPLTDYFTLVMARAHAFDDPDYIHPVDAHGPRQEELRISA